MTSVAKTYLTPEEYLALERKSEIKHEYDRGQIIAMAGASRAHNLISANIARVVGNQLVDRPCELYGSDMRVRLESGLYVYPDVVVTCNEPRFEDGEVDILLNPTVIVEVLSPSTERRDRGRKSERYRALPSLQEYLMVEQDEVRVEHYIKVDGKWASSELKKIDETVHLASIGCELPLRQIYAKVAFSVDPQD